MPNQVDSERLLKEIQRANSAEKELAIALQNLAECREALDRVYRDGYRDGVRNSTFVAAFPTPDLSRP
jgi:hypothetical protein